MKKLNKTKLGITVFIIIIIVLIILFSIGRRAKEEGVIKIGAILPLTGPASFVGEGESHAIQIAVEEINRNNGINGKQIQLILEDSKSEGATAVTAIQKLINIDKVDLLIGGSTYEMMAVKSIAEENKIPIITPCSSKPAVTEGNDYVFRLMASDNIQARWAAFVVHNFLNKTKVAILYTNDEWGVGWKNEFIDELNKLGGTIVKEEAFAKGDKDLKTQLIKIKNVDPEIIVFLGFEAETILGFKQMEELKIDVPILGGASWASPKIWQELGEIGNEAMYVRVHTETEGEFKEKYITKTGSSQIPICTPEAYDAVYVLKEAIIDAKSLNKERIKDAIYKVNMSGVSGIIKFNSVGDRYPVRMSLFKIENTVPKEIKTQDFY